MNRVEIRKASGSDLICIENMMQFYMYDISEWLPLAFGENGYLKIRPKAEYLARLNTHPYFIKVEGELAGFVTVDDDVQHKDSHHNIGYFFVAKRFRGQGVGRAVVGKLVGCFSGVWEIYFVDRNLGAAKFWNSLIPTATAEKYSKQDENIDGYDCTLFKFSSADFPTKRKG